MPIHNTIRNSFAKGLFVLFGLFCLLPFASPGVALAIGFVLSLTVGNAYLDLSKKVCRPLLQASVVLLGFGMNLQAVFVAARQGFLLAMATIASTFLLGALIGRFLRLPRTTSTLLSAGTAICGGSAIAAVALAIGAAEAEISVAMGSVFMLNAVALYLFPALGHGLGLSQTEFGVWSGVAIHDVSSVVGAASAYGTAALQTATAVKLSRTLWIIPVATTAGWVHRTESAKAAGVTIPWFVGLFILASLAGTFLPPVRLAAPWLQSAAKTGMTSTLFLIGAGLTRESLKKVGVRPLLQGLTLWLLVSIMSLAAIRWLGA